MKCAARLASGTSEEASPAPSPSTSLRDSCEMASSQAGSVERSTRTRADPAWVEVEITENAVMDDVETALNVMRQIRELGVSIAIDDFGTGYSSLNYLKNFTINTLKIDVSFVADLPVCHRAAAIAKTVVSLGHGLGLRVVAEGVEIARAARVPLRSMVATWRKGIWSATT